MVEIYCMGQLKVVAGDFDIFLMESLAGFRPACANLFLVSASASWWRASCQVPLLMANSWFDLEFKNHIGCWWV